jgi:DNA-binding response OmpR family regulator
LIRKAFGESYDGFDRTIDTHAWSLRKKLGEPPGKPKIVLSEPGIGYRLGDLDAE